MPSNIKESPFAIALGINSVFKFLVAAAIAVANLLRSSALAAFWFRVKPCCLDKAAIVSSKLNTFKLLRFRPPSTVPLPAPGAPARIIALGELVASFNIFNNLII